MERAPPETRKDTVMTQSTDQTPTEAPAETDLGSAVHRVLGGSPEPLTVPKIRARLPAPFRNVSLEELADCLNRQVAAKVLFQYPKYRSQQDRYWDRPMPVHVASLLRATLQDEPLPWSELRRKLPAYALMYAEGVLADQVAQGKLHRHPGAGKRGRERFGSTPADPKAYLRSELSAAFHKLERLGFSQAQLRAGALELLHDEEWASAQTRPETRRTAGVRPSGSTSDLQALDQSELHPDSPDALSDAP
jgi:hypothetical protein